MNVLDSIILLLAASVVTVAILRRLKMPPVLGYFVVGVVLGPSALGLVSDTADVRLLAEFGVVFLLFSIGLEFSLPQLLAMKRTVLGLGGLQVSITSVLAGLLAWMAGLSPEASIVVGGAVALSSTAIVTKQLAEQLEIHSRHGRKAVGVLLFQDIAVVPLLILIPLLAQDGGTSSMGWELSKAMAKGTAVFLVMLALGRWALRPLFHEVASSHSNELFTLTALLVALLAAWATHHAGLSLALGAFLAGIMLGETEYRHQIEDDIRPFRDVLLGLFFITVGMLLNISILAELWHWVLLVVIGLVAIKGLIVFSLVMLGERDNKVAWRTALILAQGGEFGFAILSLALSQGVIAEEPTQVVLAAIVISMLAAPLLIRSNDMLASRLSPSNEASFGSQTEQIIEEQARELNQHVLICGFGRTGQNVARFLQHESIPYLAFDLDPARVREARAAGEPVTFGNAARRELLNAGGLERARMVVITYDDAGSALRTLEHTREMRPRIPVMVRCREDAWLERFENAGATAVVPEQLEAALMLSSHALAMLEVPVSRVFRYVREVRADRYRLLRSYFHGEEKLDLEKADRFRDQLHAVTLPEGAYAVGKLLAELQLHEVDVNVEAVRRGGIRGPQPEPDTKLLEGDVLVLFGTPESLEKAEAMLLGGSWG